MNLEILNHSTKDLSNLTGLRPTVISGIRAKRRKMPALAALNICWEYGITLYPTKSSCEKIPYKKIYLKPDLEKFWENIDSLFENQNIMREFFKMHFDHNEYKAIMICRGRNQSPSFDFVLKIADEYDLSPFHLFSTFDKNSVLTNKKAQFSKANIPNRYTKFARSKMRVFKSAVTFAKHHYPESWVEEALNSLQITKDALSIRDKDINIVTFHDFHQKMRAFDADDQFFIMMGANCTTSKATKTHLQQFHHPSNTVDAYRVFNLDLIQKFEMNFNYEVIEQSKKHIVVKTWPKSERIRENGPEGLVSREVMLFRFGHYIRSPYYYDIKSGNLKKSTYSWNENTGEAIFHIIY